MYNGTYRPKSVAVLRQISYVATAHAWHVPITQEKKIMVAPIHDGTTNTVLVIQPKHFNGNLFVAMIPDDLDAQDINDALQEAGIEPERVCEIQKWKKTSKGVRVGFLPIPTSH